MARQISTLNKVHIMRRIFQLALTGVLSLSAVFAQSTQGLISGSILNSVSGQPLDAASITFTSEALSATGTYKSDSTGAYFLPMLSPGMYSVRATAAGFQSQELQQLELPVAGRIQIDFRMRPISDVWESGQFRSVFLPGSKTIVTFYGPDVDTSRSGSFEGQRGKRGTLDTSVSYVIDPDQIAALPLQGRDVYTMLVSLPGIAANNGTARGLGISVAGQRPSASNFLLDGVDNNNFLVTGPLSPAAPEAIQEYRISTNNYSAEYGQTSGFVANAVTRAGGREFHGLGYEYLKNDALNAADFADNLTGFGRRVAKENRFGYQVGGPVLRNRLYFSSALEQLISHGLTDPLTYSLPTKNFLTALNVQPARLSRQLLEKYPAPVINSTKLTADYKIQVPVVVDRLLLLERGDYTFRGGRDHLMARLAMARVSQPNFIWSPYKDFTSGLQQNTTGLAGNWTHTFTPRITSELKFSYSDDNLWWDRAHPEIPTLSSGDGTLLPGSPAFYAYRNHNHNPQAIYSAVWTRNRHIVSAGAGLLLRTNEGYLTAGRDGQYIFGNIVNFAFDQPQFFRAPVNRLSATPTSPDFNRTYKYAQSYFFIQDSFRLTGRLTLNYGLRYEWYGAPQNTGATKDALVVFGAGGDFNSRLATAKLQIPSGSGDQALYGADNTNFAPRFGFSFDPLGKGKTVIRGGFGMFFDRPFDNLWQNVRNNGYVLPLYTAVGTPPVNYLQGIAAALPSYAKQGVVSDFPGLTLMDPKLKNGYNQSFYVGIQQSLGDNLSIDINGTGSLARRLITTDLVNRQFTTLNGDGRPSQTLPDISWRSGQGSSHYLGLSTVVKYRLRNMQLQGAYTWSHAIDNQSDPLVGDFFDLNFTTISNATGGGLRSAFSRQYDSSSDRGNSDFDQRHSLFILGTWQSEARRFLTRGWQVSWMAAFRSGLPYTIRTVTTQAPDFGSGLIQNQRADLLNPRTAIFASPKSVPGGILLLNEAAFQEPGSASVLGTSGRNAFAGPGLYNIDLSIARTFSVRYAREGTRLTIRADAFNFLNHANLNSPDSLLGSPTFGIATYGRQGTASGFPAVSPVNESARQIQLLVRLEF